MVDSDDEDDYEGHLTANILQAQAEYFTAIGEEI